MSDDDHLDQDDHPLTLSMEREQAIDDLGRRVGAELRSPAPATGLAEIKRQARNRRLMQGAVAVTGVAVLIIGVAVINRDDNDARRVPITTVTVTTTPESTVGTTVPATTEPSAAIERGATAQSGDRWAVSEPGAIDLQYHAGSPPAMMVVADGGRSIVVRNFWDWNLVTPIPVTDATGSPLTVVSLHSTVFLTIALTSDGRLVQVDPWHYSASVLPHPGVVTGVALTGILVAPFLQPFWAAGFEQVDGQLHPVVWYDTGLVSDDQGSVSGVPTATLIARGEAGSTGRPLIAGSSSGAFALLPEPDGMSRLWVLHDEGDTAAVRTELRFRDPTEMVMGGDEALWIADGDGLHTIDLVASPVTARIVSNIPVRSLNWLSPQSGYAVLVLDTEGAVKAIAGSGDTREYTHDDAATDVVAFMYTGLDPQLFLVHGNADEVVVVDAPEIG